MRQSTRAVALLLSSANAAIVDLSAIGTGPTQFYYTGPNLLTLERPTVSSAASGTLGATYNPLQDRRAAYAPNPAVGGVTYSWAASPTAQTVTGDTSAADLTSGVTNATFTAGSGCPLCVQNGGVWCSRTYAYDQTDANYQYAQTVSTSTFMTVVAASTAAASAGTTDLGACCQGSASTDFQTLLGKVGTAAGTIADPNSGGANTWSAQVTAQTCPAMKSAGQAAGKPGSLAFDNSIGTAFSSWWCSNGLYKRVVSNASSGTGIANTVQALAPSQNPRAELALVGCPQRRARCGGASPVVDLDAASPANLVFTIKGDSSTGGPAAGIDKCTWVAHATTGAPAFVMSGGSGNGAGVGLKTANWVIHNMEYVAGATFSFKTAALQESASTTGYLAQADDLGVGNYVPTFDMDAAHFATLRTWYGQGGAALPATAAATQTAGPATTGNNNQADWHSPYSNSAAFTGSTFGTAGLQLQGAGRQYYGNVAAFPCATFGSASAASAAPSPAGACYGNAGTGSSKFDFRVVRYFPAQVALTVHAAGTALNSAYAAQVTAFDSAKSTWDAYVAILAKNAKTDAFAAFFSPPKAPTVPPLPSLPWRPAAYSGYLKQSPERAAVWAANTGAFKSAAQPTAQEFWYSADAAQTIGGWGAWTAQLLTYREGWGKSFGTIGYSWNDASGNATKMGQVWNQRWMCNSGGSASATTACAAPYSVSADATSGTAQSVVANTGATTSTGSFGWGQARFVSVVSLWSLGDAQTGGGFATSGAWYNAACTTACQQSFVLTWSKATWSTELPLLSAAITAPAAPTAASSLTGIAGAQALAASAAAALATAAALY